MAGKTIGGGDGILPLLGGVVGVGLAIGNVAIQVSDAGMFYSAAWHSQICAISPHTCRGYCNTVSWVACSSMQARL